MIAAELEIFKNLFHSTAEEMGAALRRSAFSPNIKERRDYSCAVFDGQGRAVAMGDHMPVHLGSMPMSVAAALNALELGPGDIAMLNDPYAGGTHLPDITLVMPVYEARDSGVGISGLGIRNSGTRGSGIGNRDTGLGIPAHTSAGRPHLLCRQSRASCGYRRCAACFHGAERGNLSGGIAHSTRRARRGGKIQRDVLAMLLANVRTPREREGDLMAQVAACRLGERRLQEMLQKYGTARTQFYMDALQTYSARLMKEALAKIPVGTVRGGGFSR